MKVYGDAERIVDLQKLLRRLSERVAATDTSHLESVRELLIEAGLVEQAVADCGGELGRNFVNDCERLTDWAADRFCSLYFGVEQKSVPPKTPQNDADKSVKVKIPEGFAFYALYPEQYCVSAARWSEQQEHHQSTIVIGLRSIGTTLSAAVNSTLRLKGLKCRRLTVRASGHPFDRKVELPELPDIDRALVVDEGPGMSGSSMAAVAEALAQEGFSKEEITFFPAHENGPGDAACEKIRSWWDSVQVVTTDLAQTRWHGLSLQQQLMEACEAESILDCSAGLWRQFVYQNETQWAAVGPQFERVKYLCRTKSGSVLWKYIGLSPSVAEPTVQEMNERAEKAKSPAPLRLCNGFVAVPWIDGERLTVESLDRRVLDTLAEYISASAQLPISASDAASAVDRLKDMALFNIREALGDELSLRVERFIRDVRPNLSSATYGDGRMAPHEWVRTPERVIWKTDSVGHDCDHTLVGKQSVYWDIAGAIVEWDMNKTLTEQLLANCSIDVNEEALLFYQLAYASFRLGFCTLNQSLTDESEQQRLRAAAEFYGTKLRRLIRTSFSNSVRILSEPGLISTRDI